MATADLRFVETEIRKAEALARRGDWHGALAAYRAVLHESIRIQGARRPELRAPHLIVMDRFADLAVPLGHTQAAREVLSAMASLSAAAGDPYGRDYALVKRMLVENGAGDLVEANTTIRSMEPTLGAIDRIEFSDAGLREWESRRFWPETDDADRAVLFAQLYLAMGSLLQSLGVYGEALQSFRRGLAFAGEGMPDLARRAAPVLHSSIAAAQLEIGDLANARSEIDPLIAEVEEPAEPALYVRVHETLAKLLLLCGDLGPAESELQRVVRVCSERGFDLAESRARLNLAQMLVFLNKTREAETSVERAAAIARGRGDQATIARAGALGAAARARLSSLAEGVSIAGSVAQIWAGEPRPDSGDAASLPASLELPQASNFLAFFEDRLLAAHWQLGLGRVANARLLLAEMRQTFRHSDSTLIALRLDAFESLVAYYEERYQEAASSLRKLLPAYADLGMKPELWQLQRVLGWCLARMNAPRSEQQQLTLLSTTLLDEITATLAPADQAIYSLNKWTPDEEYLGSEIDRLIAAKRRADGSPAPLRLYLRLQLARRLRALSQRIDRFKEERALPLRLHPAHAATLKFLILPDRVLVIERTRFRIRFGVSPVSRIRLRGLVRDWHEWISGLRTGNFETEAAAIAREVGAALQITSALEQLPPRVKSIRIIPDDSLHGFPFAVLMYQGKYLVESFKLSIHASERRPERRRDRRPAKALFVGVSAETRGFPPLTRAGEEQPPFRAWTGGAPLTDLRDERASRQSVAAELESAAFAHVACHGVYVPNQLEATGLVLMPHPPGYEVLSIADVARLRLDQLRHLTLSACWGADNFLLPGRWAVSFPQRFCLAGAETVVACLWEVDQDFAVPFFKKYYSYLANYRPSQALALAQRDAIGNTLSSSDPVYWAGYRVYGGRD